MGRKSSVLEWLLTWSWIIILVLGVIGIVAYTACDNQLILALSTCFFTTAIFYFFVTYLPYRFMREQRQRVICLGFYRLREALRQGKSSIYSSFNFAVNLDVVEEDDYIRDFENADFEDFWMQPKTKYEKFEEERISAKNIAEYLQLQPTLSLRQQKIISDILSSIYATEGLRYIPHSLSAEERVSYPDNQKEMGECLFHLYKSLIED